MIAERQEQLKVICEKLSEEQFSAVTDLQVKLKNERSKRDAADRRCATLEVQINDLRLDLKKYREMAASLSDQMQHMVPRVINQSNVQV